MNAPLGPGRLLHLGALEVSTTPDNSSTRLVIETFGPAELRRDQLEQLADEVLAHLGQQRVDAVQLNEEGCALERQRDEALARVKHLEQQLREQLAEVEMLKSAGDLADRREHALEAEVAELRAELEGPTTPRART